jgi:hypothetical protein
MPIEGEVCSVPNEILNEDNGARLAAMRVVVEGAQDDVGGG